MNITVTKIMSKIIICVLQVIHINHYKRGSFKLLRMFPEQRLTFPLERPSVVKTCKCIIISFMFNIHTFPGNFGNIFHKSDSPVRLCLYLHTDIPDFSSGMLHTIDFCAITSNRIGTAAVKILQKFHKLFSCHRFF